MSWNAWVELRSGQSWSPAEMVATYKPRYLIECSGDSVLLNVFGPFGYGDRLAWLQPIAPLRNAETDASPEVFGSPGFRGTSDSDFTWVLLSELETYDLNQSTVRWGFVSTELSVDFTDPPSPFPKAAFAHGVPAPRSHPESTKGHGFFGIRVQWLEFAHEFIGYFWDQYVPKLRAFGSPDSVRLFVQVSW